MNFSSVLNFESKNLTETQDATNTYEPSKKHTLLGKSTE